MAFVLRRAARSKVSFIAFGLLVVLSVLVCSCTSSAPEFQPLDDPGRAETAMLGRSGGTIVLNGVTIEAPPGALVDDTMFMVTGAARPAPLVEGLATAGAPIGIHATDNFRLPVDITVKYDPAIDDPQRLSIVHFNSDRRAWELLKIVAVDASAHTLKFETRDFSVFQGVSRLAGFPKAASVVGFDPVKDGWSVPNTRNCIVGPGGCMGMARRHSSRRARSKRTARCRACSPAPSRSRSCAARSPRMVRVSRSTR